jgi:prefoldin subunit 5
VIITQKLASKDSKGISMDISNNLRSLVDLLTSNIGEKYTTQEWIENQGKHWFISFDGKGFVSNEGTMDICEYATIDYRSFFSTKLAEEKEESIARVINRLELEMEKIQRNIDDIKESQEVITKTIDVVSGNGFFSSEELGISDKAVVSMLNAFGIVATEDSLHNPEEKQKLLEDLEETFSNTIENLKQPMNHIKQEISVLSDKINPKLFIPDDNKPNCDDESVQSLLDKIKPLKHTQNLFNKVLEDTTFEGVSWISSAIDNTIDSGIIEDFSDEKIYELKKQLDSYLNSNEADKFSIDFEENMTLHTGVSGYKKYITVALALLNEEFQSVENQISDINEEINIDSSEEEIIERIIRTLKNGNEDDKPLSTYDTSKVLVSPDNINKIQK